MRRRITAVVTAYRPSREILKNVARIAHQTDGVIVVDDGSGAEYSELLEELAANGADVVKMERNRGIAAALNAGVLAAELAADDLLLTFDQDSALPNGFVAALVARWDAATSAHQRVGLVAPARFAGLPQTMADGTTAREPIQSGTLFSGEVLAAAGPFREELFIDLVDVEYFFRLRALGYQTLAVEGLDLPHELGRSYAVTVFGRPIRVGGRLLTTSLSTPFRYYYRARNRIVIDAEYGDRERELLRRDHAMELRHLLFVLAYARPRRAMVALLRRGRHAGRQRVMGPMPDEVQRLAATIRWSKTPIDATE
nr:glycosyltransferase [Planctomonas sp. JC2975]